MIAVNFNILNQKGAPAVYEDTAANRPDAGQSGRLFIATDTKILQRDNGTSYDTIGDNSLLGANNGLTLNGNDVELGGTLTKNTSITASVFGLGLGVAGNDKHKLYVVNSDTGSGLTKDGTAAILAQRNFATSTADFDNKNLYGIAGTFIANLSSGKINSGSSYNNAAVCGSLNITANNGQSTGYIRSVQAAAVFTDVNLQNVRLIEAKQISFSGSNTVTNLSGLYIESLKTGEITNAYGIYQAGANDVNYFAGALIGTSATFTGAAVINGATSVGSLGINAAASGTEKLLISGVNNYDNGIRITGNSSSGIGMVIANTEASGREFDIYSSGSGNILGVGYLGILDATAGLNRLTISPTGVVNITGALIGTQYNLSALNAAPLSASDTGTLGETRITATYIYVCTATNTWVRSALATW